MPVKTQECSTPGCTNDAAFTTRTKPAWCTGCIDELLRQGGLKADEPFPGPKAYRLCTCLECGVQAHYKFDYVLEKNGYGEKTCRACFWKAWAQHQRELLGYHFESALLELLRDGFTRDQILTVVPTQPARQFLDEGVLPVERIAERLGAVGLELIDPLGEVHDHYDPVVVRCQRCGKISAARPGDFGSGCTCTKNPRSTPAAAPRSKPNLLIDSQHKALEWWDHDRNDEADFCTVTIRATRDFRWLCPQCGHSLEASVNKMTQWLRCPRCEQARSEQWHQEYEQWKVTPVAAVPELLDAWADEDDPHLVMVAASGGLRRFRCPEGHYARVGPQTYMRSGCPSCRGAQTRKTNQRWVSETLPEIASQWHPDKNGKWTPSNVLADSERTIWWRTDCCGHEWPESPRSRDGGSRWRCSQCSTVLGSLAWHDPGLAAEWSPENPKTAWQVRPHANTPFVPEWVCATDPTHVWQAPLSGRSNGAECPECKQVGKSRVELDHHAAAEEVFGAARSGAVLRHEAFATRKSWTADISVSVDGLTVVVEYDGARWHNEEARILTDRSKSADLLAAGYALVRLREDDLPPLEIDHPRYREIQVYSKAPRPQKVMVQVQQWLNELPLGTGGLV
jgi:hypothetical protein